MNRSKGIAVAIVCAALLCFAVFPANRVDAAISCQGRSTTYDGTSAVPNNPYGSYYGANANIISHVPLLCTTNASWSDSAAWTMLAGGIPSQQYAQAGYGRMYGDSTAYYFTEYRQDGNHSFVRKEYGAISGGQNQNYQVAYNTGGYIDLWAAGNHDRTNFNPVGIWSTPFKPQWEGETHDPGDDVPGTASNPTTFANLEWELTANSGFSGVSGIVFSSGSPRYGISSSNQSQFNIWTN